MSRRSTAFTEAQYEAGFKILGPIFAQYLARLDHYISSFEEQHSAKVVFATRAGIRIRRLYEAFVKARGFAPVEHQVLWISRFLAVKGLWNRTPEAACRILAKEFAWSTCGDIVTALFRSEGSPPNSALLDDPSLRQPGSAFWSMMQRDTPVTKLLGGYLRDQGTLFEEYIAGLIGKSRTVAIVDSGWQGTAQVLLQKAYPDIDWWGIYFGRSFMADSDRTFARKMVGLMFEADSFSVSVPMSSIVLHRHLVEGMLEPDVPSVERLVKGKNAPRLSDSQEMLKDEVSRESAPLFSAVLDYVGKLPAGNTLADVARAYEGAASKLARILAYPTKKEALLFGHFQRSADFGRSLRVQVLIDPRTDAERSAEQRIEQALWTSGQIALDYPSSFAAARQRQALGITTSAESLESLIRSLSISIPSCTEPARRASVAVIMRTMDRPHFLERAIRSVAKQAFQDFQLVIVCDGGPIGPVVDTVNKSAIDERKVVVVDNVINRGMEAASNIGIAASDSDFIVIHDDDDTWDENFLQTTVKFLRGKAGTKYGGVITHSWYVSEEVTPNGIVFRDKRTYQDWVDNIQFMELCCGNLFPPITFLFRRSVYDEIGKFDERLPVLGDWDFNLRFVLNFDIGVIKEKLAFYHHRDTGQKMFANSVIGDLNKHAEYSAIMRNKYLRARELSQEGSPAKALVSMAHVIADIRNTVRAIDIRFAADPTREPSVTAQLKTVTDTADDRWVVIHYLRGATLGNRMFDELAWRADCQWVQVHASVGKDTSSSEGKVDVFGKAMERMDGNRMDQKRRDEQLAEGVSHGSNPDEKIFEIFG